MPYNIHKGKVVLKQPFEIQNLFYKFDFHIDKDYMLDYREKHISEYECYTLLSGRDIYGLKVNNIDYFEELERKFLNDYNLLNIEILSDAIHDLSDNHMKRKIKKIHSLSERSADFQKKDHCMMFSLQKNSEK